MANRMEGYGYDFAAFDKITAPLRERAVEKWGKPAYQNWYPFRSPKGAWMAFHNTSYTDIRIVNLDTMDVVVDGDFYSHLHRDPDGQVDWRSPETVYGSHTNHSTYVPAYSTHAIEPIGKTDMLVFDDYDFEDGESLDSVFSVPIAINAWTIWAADYEFYVDVMDLSLVDDGIVRHFHMNRLAGAAIPISASHVRNFVKPSTEHWVSIGPNKGEDDGAPTFDAHILTESHLGRITLDGEDKFHDIYAAGDKQQYSLLDPPWHEVRRRMEARANG